ncbi:MAG TPA: TIGR00153 family protein [Chlamydiales bacterium]|nr:TIGR00153 family protein [Chlamydiales bacterium]
MRALTKLFGKSPFTPLKSHMEKVALCIEKLTEIFASLGKADLEPMSRALSELEHEADIVKNDIRNHLKGIYLPIDRSQFLEILSLQDNIADKAEEIALLLTLYPLESLDVFANDLQEFFRKNLEAFQDVLLITGEMEELLESSFGGIEAEKVKRLVEKTAFKEYEADKAKYALTKMLFAKGQGLSTPGFYLWHRLINEVGQLSHLSERLANRIRMILELK